MEKLNEIINYVLDNSDLEQVKVFNSKMRLIEDFGMDSLMLAELTVRIEDEFDIDIFEDEIITSYGQILEKLGMDNE